MKQRRIEGQNLKTELARRLQADCSQSNKDLADALHVDPATLSRVRSQLEDEKFIQSYHARLNPDRYGLTTLAFVKIALEDKDEKHVKTTVRFLVEDPRILEMHALAGPWDYLLKIRVKKPADLMDLHNEKLQPKFNIRSDEFIITMGTAKETSNLGV